MEGNVTDKLLHKIFFWLGRTTPIDAQGTAAYAKDKLDRDALPSHHPVMTWHA